jgi:hypothetical protein
VCTANKKSWTHHADAQYTERNRLDLAIPRRLFPKIVSGLHVVREAKERKKQLEKLHPFLRNRIHKSCLLPFSA